MNNVTKFPSNEKPPELLIGPFEEWRVVVDGRIIPQLTGFREGDGHTCLVLDHRFAVTVPNDLAHGVAYVIANALAIGQGYPSMNAETKDQPFAPKGVAINAPEQG